MEKFVFLDIDDVLLPHDFPNLRWLSDMSGFNDWEKSSHKYMKFVSRDLLNMVNELFGENIYWLTTWELLSMGANVEFCDYLELPHYKELPYIGEYYNQIGGIWVPNAVAPASKNWWKGEMIDRFINELTTEDYKLLWVDNELDHHLLYEDPLVVKTSKIPQVKHLSPYPVLTRRQIQEASDWLNS